MKVAVLLFGHLRDFEVCAPTLKQIVLDRYDCDVFIHTWDVTEPTTHTWHRQRTKSKAVDDEVKRKIESCYNPKRIIIEHQNKYDKEQIVESLADKSFTFSTAGCYFMFHSMNQANQLRIQYEKGADIQYDMILVTRPDVLFKTEFSFEKVIEQSRIIGLNPLQMRFFAAQEVDSKSLNSLYINEPNDLLFFGVPDVINRYIEWNLKLDIDFIKKHVFNVVSIYTSREIEAGIMPIPIAYTLGMDWSFSGSRSKTRINSIRKPKWVKICLKCVAFLFRPIFWLYRKAPWINYYE